MSNGYYRLVTFLINICTDVLKELFLDQARKDTTASFTSLDGYLAIKKNDIDALKKKKVIRKDQYDLLFPVVGLCDETSWDISLFYALIVNIHCTSVGSVRKDIETIREIRNGMQHIANIAKINDSDFEQNWKRLTDSTLSIANFVKGKPYENIVKAKVDLTMISYLPELGNTLSKWHISTTNELQSVIYNLKEQVESMKNDVSTSATILSSTCEKRPSCNTSGKPNKRFKTVSQSLDRLFDDFRKTMNAEQFEDFYPPDECAEIRRRVAADRFVVITGYGKSFYLRTALYVVKELDEYKQEFCAMISDPTDWKHIEPKELKLVLFNCPFGETEPNKRKTRAMLDILNNVQLTTKDSECPLVVIVVTQWEIMQTALKSVGSHHGLLDEPVKLYKENNEQEPEIIDDGVQNLIVGTKGKSMKTMIEITKSYREDYSYPVSEESVKSVRVKMKGSKFVLISGKRRDVNTAVALRLAQDYDDRRFVIVRNKSDISNIDLQNISLLMVEDIAGKYKYDDTRLANWLETFDSLLSLVRKGKLNLVATIESDKMERGKNELGLHPIFRHEVQVSPSDSICVKQEMDNPFASIPTQEPTSKGTTVTSGAPNSNKHTGEESDDKYDASDGEPNSGPVKVLDNADAESNDEHGVSDSGSNDVIVVSDTESIEYAVSDEESDDESFDLTWSSLPVVSQNHTNVAYQAQASSHHGIPSLGFVKNLSIDPLMVNCITILSERCLVVSTHSSMVYSYHRQQGIIAHNVELESVVQQLTTVDENKVVGTLPSSGNVVVINVSNTGVLTILKTIDVGMSCCGIAHSSGHLIISYDSGYEVRIMDMDGNVERTFSVEQGISRNPFLSLCSKLALSPNHDTIYIYNRNNAAVTALTREGRILGVVELNTFTLPSSIAVDSVGRVYVWCLNSNSPLLVSPENGTVTTLSVVGRNSTRSEDASFCKWTNSIYVAGILGVRVFKINDL
ncbi:uncharacterized protein LOC128223876 isoform X2 [Mya arenaria]|uniref:uncharacterized protein LOC128223876 isoform X2 n=1 Tax=Mya arenaria TaxID=6604 RepID=UPI0022DEBBE1|nr:uncharacterized protein LOC128223876 isoform X2 [Mya arenaria]